MKLVSQEALRQANATPKLKISQGLPLSSPTRQYAIDITMATKHLTARATILGSKTKEQSEILGARKYRISGKRSATKGEFMLSRKEIHRKL